MTYHTYKIVSGQLNKLEFDNNDEQLKHMQSTKDIVGKINLLQVDIIKSFKQESIDVYLFLKSKLDTTDVTYNHLFQYVYRHFYGMNRAGLTDQFYKEYFKTLEKYKNKPESFNLEKAIKRFLEFNSRTRKGKEEKSLQFSFLTKLSHSINPKNPIYDQFVCKACGISQYYDSGKSKKIERLLDAYKKIESIYLSITKENLLSQVVKEFDENFNTEKLTTTMKYDFIFWEAGKLLANK